MIIFRYLLKEVAKTQLAIFLILMAIFISQKFVSILEYASEGGLPAELVMLFIALTIPDLAGMLVPLSFFLGVLLAYGRIYADSEMTVLHACGVSEWYIVRVTLLLGVIMAIITGIFTLYLQPMASEKKYLIEDELAAETGLSSIIAGRFQNTGNGKAVVFVKQKNRDDNSLEQVFVAQLPNDRELDNTVINTSLVYAEKGLVVEDEYGGQKLSLFNGTRYQSSPDNNEYHSLSFSKYHIEIQEREVESKIRKLWAVSTIDLFKLSTEPANALIHWRFALPLTCIMLTLIAVPLSRVNPRQGKYGKLMPALLLFLAYFLMLSGSRSSLNTGKIPADIGMWPVHAVALMLGISFLMNSRTSGIKFKAKLFRAPWRKKR